MSAIENYYVNILLLPLTPRDLRDKTECYLSSSKIRVSPRSYSIDWTDSLTFFFICYFNILEEMCFGLLLLK